MRAGQAGASHSVTPVRLRSYGDTEVNFPEPVSQHVISRGLRPCVVPPRENRRGEATALETAQTTWDHLHSRGGARLPGYCAGAAPPTVTCDPVLAQHGGVQGSGGGKAGGDPRVRAASRPVAAALRRTGALLARGLPRLRAAPRAQGCSGERTRAPGEIGTWGRGGRAPRSAFPPSLPAVGSSAPTPSLGYPALPRPRSRPLPTLEAVGRPADPLTLVTGPPSPQVLSGCGVYDGTELHEASSILVHLSRGGAEVQIFAPDVPQMHVIDHIKGQPSEGETRSTFAVDGGTCKVNRDVERVLKEFHQAGKPIGSGLLTSCFQAACPSLLGLLVRIMDGVGVQPALCQASAFIPALQEPLEACTSASPADLCCIAPVLAAKVLRGVEVTVGHEQEEGGKWPHAGTAEVIKALGAKHCVMGVTEAHVDQKNKVVTTPAFMCDTALHHIHDGIGAMVRKVLELAGR
uniref:DJ-1/PfpI domain-containing protein n=1 Tax=Bos indicus x Bos taurus TaxID=30522 RepID=A0A4W2F2W0_BOBOX